MEKHLKPYQYYSDLYDRHTVEECRWWNSRVNHVEVLKLAEDKKLDKEEALRILLASDKLHNYFYTGERYIQKESTIEEWMNRDKARDQIVENAKAPEDITCLSCGRLMFVSSQHLDFGHDNKPDRMFFFYDCPLKHLPRRAFYDDGEEWKRMPHLCPKCNNDLEDKNTKVKNKIITKSICSSCGYTEKNELDLSIKKSKKEKLDANFAKDREKFCLSEKAGQEFISAKQKLEDISKFMDGLKEKEKNKDLYDKVNKLQKLKIIDLEKLLAPILEKAGYIKLQFKNPEISKDVFVPFVVYDQKADREDRSSTYGLEVLLRKSLKNTNWRLMSEGTSYRLGMLEGRLHGYEREDDLLNLVKQQDKKDSKKININKDNGSITL